MVFNLSDSDFSRIVGFGGSALNFAGNFIGNRNNANTLDTNAQIAELNAQEIAKIVPLQIAALESDIESIRQAAEIREREIVEGERRADRQFEFGSTAFAADRDFALTSKSEVELRSDFNDQLLTGTIDLITLRSTERLRELERDRRDKVAEIRSISAASGVSVRSGSTEAVREDEEANIAAQKNVVSAEAKIGKEQAVLRNELDQSTFRERLAAIDRQLTDIELEEKQLNALFEDALFDAGIEREVNERNRDIAISRAEFEQDILARRGEIGIASALAEAEAFEEGAGAATLQTLLAAGGLGLDALQAFPGLGSTIAQALGFGGTAAIASNILQATPIAAGAVPGLTAGGVALPAGGGAIEIGVFAELADGVGASSVSVGEGGFVSTNINPTSILADFQAGLELGLSADAALAGTAANFAQFLGQIALPVAAILAIPKVASLIAGTDNDVQAIGRAKEVVVTRLFQGTNLERAKALLRQPNNFSDPNPRTVANLQQVVNFVEDRGGISALPEASRPVYRQALADLQKQKRAELEAGAGFAGPDFSGPVLLSDEELRAIIDERNIGAP